MLTLTLIIVAMAVIAILIFYYENFIKTTPEAGAMWWQSFNFMVQPVL